MVSWPGPTECRRSSTQRDPECSGRHARASPQTRLRMNSLDRRHRGGRTAKQGQIKYTDGFMDETDREVSSLTDRAFRSLCVGEEAAYTDPELTSSPRDAFAVELPATFQHSFIDSQDQGPRHVSQLSNGAIEAMWQNRRSRSRVSSLIKAFSSSEGGSTMDGAPDGRRSNPDGWAWESSVLLSLNNELSNFPAYCRDPFTPAASLQASHLGPASASSKTLRNKAIKATFRKLSSINYFLHSEHSPFQTWADYNRIPCQREATPPTLSPSGFHRWYDSPLYKELTASHGIQVTHSEDVKSYWMLSKDRTPSEPARSVIQPKPAAVEKRCESEVVAKCPLWRKNRNQLSSQLPVYRPCTASPCSHASRRRDDASLSGSRPSATHHQVHTLVGGQTAGSCTPFSISQLLTPVLNHRQEMETSEVSQYELLPADDLAALRHAEPCPPPELKLRDSYKAMASSLLFNLKDNRKRVKSTYSPARFKGLELSDSDNLPSRQDNAALASNKSASGPPGTGISTYLQPGAAEARSVYSPALQPTKASAADHKKYTEANRLDDYFTLISPPTVKEAPHYSDSDRITQESTQQRDQVFANQNQYRHSQHLPSTSNEILSRNKSNQPTWKEYKTSPTEQLSTGGPTGSSTVTYSVHERRNSFSVKEKDVIRRDELLHNKMDTTQSLAAFKKHDTGQEVQENRNSPNTDAFNLCENINVRSTRSSLRADEQVRNKPSGQILQVQKWGGTTQGIHALKEKSEADTGSHTSNERQNTTHCLFPQKESELSRIAMNEIKEKGQIRLGVHKIQVNDPDSHSMPASSQNLQDLSIGTMNDQTTKIPAKGLNELSSSGLCTMQNDEPATKHTHSLKENKHISDDMLPKPEGPTEKTASQRNEELPDQGQKSVGYSSKRETTSDNCSNYTQAKPRAGQHATGLKLPESDTTPATEQVHMKNEHPSEDYYWAKQSEQMTNEEILNKRHPSVRKTREEKMLAQNSIKAGTEFELSKGEGSDDPETDGQEKRERFLVNAVRKNDGFVQERKKRYPESHAATEQEVNSRLKEQEARENKHIKSKQPEAFDEEVFSRMESHPVGNGKATRGGNDPARCILAEKCNKHNGLANKDNHKVKHRILTFNQRDHAMQELLTSKVKAHAQKEIIAIKEKGHAKREGIISYRKDSRERVNDGQGIANQGVAIASENWDMKAETPQRECSNTDTLPRIKENEAPQTEVKQETTASQGSQESNHTAPFAKKEGAGNAGLHGKKNTINDRQELLQTGNLHIQKPSNDIKETYSKQDLKQKHHTCISEKKQDPANKEVHENRVGDKQELLSVDSGKAETVAVNSQSEVTPADKQKDITSKTVLSSGEKGHTLNKKNASLGGFPKASLELSARTTEESDNPHKDRLTNNEQPKQEGRQYKNKEHTQNEATITDKYYPSDQGKFPTETENPAEVCTLPNIRSTNEKLHKDLLKEMESVNEGDRMELGTQEECSTVVAASMQNVQDGKEDKSTGTPMRNVPDKKDDKSMGTSINNVQDKKDDKSTGTTIKNVQSRKEVLGTIENEFVKINVFAITRKVDTEWEDPSSKRNDNDTMCEIKERGQVKEEVITYTVGSENASRINNQTVKTAGEGKSPGKQELPTKQNCPTSETVEEFSKPDIKRPMEHDIQGGNATKEITKPVVLKAEQQSKIVPLVKHEHTFPVTQARKGITNECEPASRKHNEEVLTAGEQNKAAVQVPAMLSTVSPTSADHTHLETPGKEDSPARKDLQPQKFPKVPTTVEGIEDSMYANSRHDKQIVFEEQPAEPEIIRTIKSSKPFKLPATETPKFATDIIKINMIPELLAKEEYPERNLCYKHNDSTELQTFATKDHTKVLMSAAEDHKSDGHNQAHAFSAEECGRKSGRKIPKSDVFEMKECTESWSQGHITTYDRKQPAPTNVQEHNKSSVHVETEITQPGVCVKPEDGKPSELVTSEHPKAEVHTKKDTAVFTEHITSAAHLMREHSKHVKPEDSKPVTMEHPKPDVGLKPENIKPGIPVPNEHPKPGVGVKPENIKPGIPVPNEHPKPGIGVKPENIKPGIPVSNEHPKPGVGVKPENIKPGIPVPNEHPKPGLGVKPGNIKPGIPVSNEHPKPGVGVKPENIKPGIPVSNEHPKQGVGVKPENIKPGIPVPNEHPKPGVGVKSENIKPGIPVSNEHPKPGVGVKPENIKPGIPVSNEHPKPGLGVKPGNIKPGIPVSNEHPKPGVGVKPENIKPGIPVSNEHPKPGVGVNPENIKPGIPVPNEHPKPGVGVKPENIKPGIPVSNEHPKPGLGVKPGNIKPGIPVSNEHPKPGVGVKPENIKPGIPVPNEHPKPGVGVKPENIKPGIPVPNEHPKLGVGVKPENIKPGIPVSNEHPKPGLGVKPGNIKPGIPVSNEHPKPGVGVEPENIKPGIPVSNEHPKPCVRLKPEHSKPRVLVTTDYPKPDVAVTTEHPKPVLHVKSEHSKTGIQVTTEYPKPGVPRTVEHQKLDIHLQSEDSKPGLPVTIEPSIRVKPGDSKPYISVSGEHPKPSVPKRTQHPKSVTKEHTKPGRPVTTEHPKPGVPIRTERPKLDIPVTTEHTKPGLCVKSEHSLSVTTEHPTPGVHLTAEHPKPDVCLTAEHSKSGVSVTTQHSKLDAPVTIEYPTPGLRVKSEHSKTGVAVTTEHPKPVTHITAEQPKPYVPITTEHLQSDMHVTPEDSNPGLPLIAKHPKLAVPKTTEYPKRDVPLTKEHPTPNVPVTIENLKPGLHVKSEHNKTVVPVTKALPKPGLPVTTGHHKLDEPAPMEHPNPVSHAKSEASKSSVPVTTEHFKSGVPVTTENPKPGIHVPREDSKAGVPVITEHPKPVVCVKQEYSKPHEPVTTDLKPGASVPKDHIKNGIPVKAEHTTPALEHTKPVVPLLKEEAITNEHPKAPLRKERHKPNVQVQKEQHELEPLCKESGNPEMLVKLKGFTSDRVLINNFTMEPAKSEVKKDPGLVPEEKGQISKHTFPSKEYTKTKMSVLTDKEDLNKVRDMHTWMERDQVISMKELEAKEDFTGRQGNSVSDKQPVYVETPKKPLNHESYLSVQEAQQTLEEKLKIRNSPGNTEIIQQRENKEEMEGLQYYAITNHDTEVQTKGALFNSSQKTEMALRTREMDNSGRAGNDDRWTHNTTYSAQAPVLSPRPDTSSPSLGKPTLFKVKDNTFKTSPVTKTVKPYFHKTFPEDLQLSSPIGSEKGEDWHDAGSEETKVIQHAVGLSNRIQQPKEHSLRSALFPSDSTATKEPRGYFRKNPALEEDECCSIGSALSEESCAAGTADVTNDRAGIVGVTEGPEILRGISERPEPTCSGNEGKTFGKPPVVPPKTEKALRRAQKLTTRRIKKAEAKVRPEGTWDLDQASLRMVSSEPPSPTGQLLSQHLAPSPNATPRYCMDPGYVPSAPKLVAQPFPLTERKLLQDPNSGQYFMVEVPVPVKTKTFFDPETGKYIQLSVRQSPEGTLSPASSVELLSPSYLLYPSFLTLPVASVPPLRSSTQMSAPAALAEDQEMLELNDPWVQKGYCPEFGQDSQVYIEPVYMQHEQPQEPTHTESKSSQRKLNIISMSELEDFAVEST